MRGADRPGTSDIAAMHLGVRTCLATTVAVVLAGCATPQEYQADASRPIRTITVAREVSEPKDMTFVGFSEMMGMGLAGGLGGPAGAGIAAGTMFSREGSSAFNVGQTARDEVIAAVRKSGKFEIRESGPADAELQVRVTGYGFYQAAMFARRVRPIFSIETKLVRNDGAVVWQHRRAVTHISKETPAILPERIRENPQVGADALRVAARICATRAIASLNR